MRIVMMTAEIKSEAGRGIAVYTNELVDGLRKEKIPIEKIFYNKGSLRSLFNLIPKLKKYDIVHIQHEYNLFGSMSGIKFIPFLLFLYFFTKCKIVITMHTVHDKKEKLTHKIPFWLWLRKNLVYPFQNKLMGLGANAIVLHTGFLAKKLVQTYRVDKKKLHVISHGVRTNSPIIKKEIAKKNLKIKGPIYLMIGNIGYQKGFDIVLNQAKKIGRNIVIFGQAIGAEDYLQKLKNQIKSNKLEKIVIVDTKIDPPESDYKKWWLYLSAADLVLLPYRSMTTSGIFISAMQAKKPCITSESEYFKEIASKYHCIEIAKKEEDYPKLIKKTMKNLKKMEKEAKRFLDNNSFKTLSNKYQHLYFNVLNQ